MGDAAISDGSPLTAAAAVVRLLLELAALIVLGYWGWTRGATLPARAALGLGLPLAVAVVWGLVGSPAAPYRLDRAWRLALELLILGSATAALVLVERPLLAAAFGAVAVLDTAALYVLDA